VIPGEPNPELGALASQRILKTERDPYRSVFDLSPVPMLLCDVGTLRVVAANAAAAKLHDASAERLEGTSLFELRRVSDLTSAMLKRALGHEIALGFGFHVRQDGSTFPVQLTVHPSELSGKPVWLCVLKSLEEALTPREGEQHRRLLEAVGRVAGGVAHDINNLLAIIVSLGGLAASRLKSAEPAHAELAEIRGAAERATQLTKHLLSLSRQGPSRPKPLQLNQVVTRLEKLLCRVLDDEAELVLDLAPDLDPVLADPAQVERLLVQLAAETRSASKRSTLRIETRSVELDTERGAERHVVLRITDGEGSLTPATATLSALVDSGNAWLEVEEGLGAQFVACFPTVKRQRPSDQRKVRSETVLVVQDNPHLRKTLRNYFAREGFQVLDAESGLEALRQVERCAGVDLLLTDFVLTDGSGGELFRALRERLPSLRVLVAIGNAEQRDALELNERTAVISKPFDLQEFGALIQRLLAQPNLT
jgi:two-component system, cell cycle sensor histidine kinase and response regulator CckA